MRAFRQLAGTAAVLAAAVALSGCAAIRDHRGFLADQPVVDAVLPGVDNQASVERSLGRPTFVSEFGRQDWYYISTATKQAAFTRPKAKQQDVIRITFDAKGNVAAVEKSGMEHVVFLNPDHHKTPTLGRERSFLEDLFGNIGTVGAPGMGGPDGTGPAPGRGPNGS